MKKKALSAAVALLFLLVFTPASFAAPGPRETTKTETRLRDRDRDRRDLSRLVQKIAKRFGITTDEDLPIPPRP